MWEGLESQRMWEGLESQRMWEGLAPLQAASSKTLEETLTNPNNATLTWNVSITYIPAGTSWLSLSSSSGTIPPLGQQDLFVTANTSALAPGTYTASLNFSGNFSPDERVAVDLVVQ